MYADEAGFSMRLTSTRALLLTLAFCATTAPLLRADAIVVTRAMTASTIAEIFIEPDRIRVELEIGVPDLLGFRDLLPDDLYERLGLDPMPLDQRSSRFFEEGLVIRGSGDTRLSGRVEEATVRRRVRRDTITGEPLPVAPDDTSGEPVVFATLVYPFPGQPETLTFSPPRDERGRPTTTLGFVAFHRDLAVNDFRYLSGDETLRLDWEDPFFSRFDNRNLRRQYDAPIAAYLYVEPFEVRKEIVLRPKDLEQWVDLGLDGKEVLTVDEQEALKEKVVDFLATRNPVTIDGQTVGGTLDRAHFIYRTLRTSGVIEPPRDLDVISATLGVIFYYPTTALPHKVEMHWDLFGERIERVPAAATDEAGPLPFILTPDNNVLEWTNFLTNPTIPGLVQIAEPPPFSPLWLVTLTVLCFVGLVGLAFRHRCEIVERRLPPRWSLVTATALVLVASLSVGAAVRTTPFSDRSREAVVTGLLENVYGAFDYRNEEIIYDTLERSVGGELLTAIYLETRRSLELENQGGARAKVTEVRMLESTHESLGSDTAFVSHCTWNVSGSVGHWGHIHQRVNQYQARFVVRAIDGVWKITDLELLQETRL